jgi:hypothetical protein
VIRSLHSPRRSIGTQRACACSHAPASAPRAGCLRAKRIPQTSFDACASPANGKNGTPPGLATRGRSRCLGRSG